MFLIMLTRVNKIYDNGVIFFKSNHKKLITILELKYGLLKEVQSL